MASNDDRQTRAIESMEKSAKEMVRVMATLNANFVMAFTFMKEQIEKDQADTDRLIENLNKVTPPKVAEDEKMLTPLQWMNELKRWWDYEPSGNMDQMKLSKQEFLTYMQNSHGTEVTGQVPNVFETRDETKFYSPGEGAGGLDSTHSVEKGD